jgi:hypothetical protein
MLMIRPCLRYEKTPSKLADRSDHATVVSPTLGIYRVGDDFDHIVHDLFSSRFVGLRHKVPQVIESR